ncbi:MAG: penicillin-binding protein 1B [Pseudomonadales bacterium]
MKRWLWIAFKISLVLLLIGAVALAGYFIHLDKSVTAKFEGRRWSIPAVVYAQPLELFAGLRISPAALILELQRVGYEAASGPLLPGHYRHNDSELRVHLRGFRFPEQARIATEVSLQFAGGLLTSITESSGAALPLIRLDPPAIGSIFPSHGEDRVIVTPQQVPELLRSALKAVEDQSFDTHHGFDLRGIARAFLINVRAGELSQGGSTLTQQLVKSYFLSSERTISRKLRELAMAIILEFRFDKADLLNAYINEVYLGQAGRRAIHGFGLGAQFYFNKPLNELTTQEIATLVTIIRGPSYYNPHRKPKRVKERRDRVLGIMHRAQLIDDVQLARAINSELTVVKGLRKGGTYYPAFMELVRDNLKASYEDTDLASQGLRVFTTLDPRLQDRVDGRVQQILSAIEQGRELDPESLQAAVIISDTQTGEVLALAGGRKAGFDGYNRAMAAARPIGSLVKPVIYLMALEQGRHLAAPIADTAVALELPGDRLWEPQNFDQLEHGQVSLVRGLADSLNLATVNLGLELGVPAVAQRLEQLSGRTTGNSFPSLLLGAEERTPLQVQQLYGTFASGGFAMTPRSVITVLDEQGKALSHHPIELEQKVDAGAGERLNQALVTVMRRGTGKTSRFAQQGVAGKTGTSDDFRDSWFAGFDAQRLAVVWIGRDDNAPTGLTGAAGAMRLWDAIMSDAELQPLFNAVQPGERPTRFDYQSGYALGSGCENAEPITLPLPSDIDLPANPDCNSSRVQALSERFQRWLQGTGNQTERQ